LHQVAEDPVDDFGAEPDDVLGWVVAAGGFTFGVGGAADVDDVDQGIGVSEIVEEAVSQAFALMGAGNETCYVEEFDWDAADALLTCAIVGFAAF
jgi:hypothetical protein